uniref:Uncharacterized protein n=1 Tax=Sphaerodactylus townsendi TaxID=933632 RepID=A0ACB8EEI8_9SAUR
MKLLLIVLVVLPLFCDIVAPMDAEHADCQPPGCAGKKREIESEEFGAPRRGKREIDLGPGEKLRRKFGK